MPIDPNLEYQKALARGASIKQAESVRNAASASAIREESDQRRRDQENDRKIREAESRANVQRRRDSQSEKYERDRERTLHEQAAQRAKADYQELPRYDLRANDAAAAVEAELEELDRQEELEKSSTQFYAKIFVLMTRHKDSQEQLFVALRDFFETTFDVSNSFSPLFSEPDYVLNRFSQDILNRNKEALVYAECLELFEEYVAKRKKKEMAEREEYIRQNKENADAYIRQCEEEAVKSLAKRAEEAKLIADREAVQAETSAKDLRYQLILLEGEKSSRITVAALDFARESLVPARDDCRTHCGRGKQREVGRLPKSGQDPHVGAHRDGGLSTLSSSERVARYPEFTGKLHRRQSLSTTRYGQPLTKLAHKRLGRWRVKQNSSRHS